MMKKQAILYVRVSTDEQADKGYSLAHQEERLRKYCDINNIDVVSLFKEDHSAKTFERPVFKQMLQFAKQNKSNIDQLLFIKWDRFSRNARDSYQMIHLFDKLGIEVCAIEQYLDLNIPEAKLMLAFYLAAPEVENDRRSLNVRSGMRRAMKDGRWVASAPLGYKNIRDENNKPVIVPDQNAEFIREAFQEMEGGLYSLEEVRRRFNAKGMRCSRSNFNRLMHNPVYSGKILIPSFRDEEEVVVQGLHEPLVNENTFWQVQNILNGRKPKTVRKAKQNLELPLRGFLQCAQCGSTLTGSASRGKLGTRYFYYHCRDGCSTRFHAKKANEEFTNLLSQISAKEEVMELYSDILKEVFAENNKEKNRKAHKLQEDIDKNEKRIGEAAQLMLDKQIDAVEYRDIKKRYDQLNATLAREKVAMDCLDSNFMKHLKGGFSFLKNVNHYYEGANTEVKQKIVGSIFREKLVFENSQYRTPVYSEVVSLILQENKELQEIKKGRNHFDLIPSRLVAPAGIEPASSESESEILSIVLRSQRRETLNDSH